MRAATPIILTLFICLISCSTSNPNRDRETFNTKRLDKVIVVQQRDLHEQSKTGNGEGLAKGVPNRPLLINNQLVFSAMGDVVLGISLAVGAINRTTELFADMAPLPMETWTRKLLPQQASNYEWQQLLKTLEQKGLILIIEPYCYLNGHPNAKLEVRLNVVLSRSSERLQSYQLVESSDTMPLQGSTAWSTEKGLSVIEFSRAALPRLLAQIPAAIDSLN